MTTALETSLDQLTGTWDVDASHSHLGFVARHAMVARVRGAFDTVEGALHLDGENPTRSSADLTIDVASVDTGDAQRDEHLRSPDFFDAEQFPTITFSSTGIEQLDDTDFRVTGDLTIRDVTRPVSFELVFNGGAVDPFGNERVGFEGELTVDRSDWGLTWNAALEAGGVLVGDRVKLELEVGAVKRS